MLIPTSTWLPDKNDDVAILAYGPAPILDLLTKIGHRTSVGQGSRGRMVWFRGTSIDAGFEVIRQAVARGEMCVHPPIGEPVVVRLHEELAIYSIEEK